MVDILALSGRDKKRLVQLALDQNKIKKDNLEFPMLWSQKIDGVFCMALKYQGQVSIFSRTGERFTSMKHIEQELANVLKEQEIILFEAHSYKTKEQSVISGWCRDTKAQHPQLHAACHDLILLEEFIEGGRVPYSIRWNILQHRVSNCDKTKIVILMQQPVHSFQEAIQLTKLIWTHGGEGGILRNPDAVYMPGKRNQDIIKLKLGCSYDLQVIAVYEGKGKYAGTLGGLTCRWKNGKVVEVSGMTDDQRREWWNNTDNIIGKIVQVDAMCESAKGLLREPRFKAIRFDKTEGDF